jgi:hypothetical protein
LDSLFLFLATGLLERVGRLIAIVFTWAVRGLAAFGEILLCWLFFLVNIHSFKLVLLLFLFTLKGVIVLLGFFVFLLPLVNRSNLKTDATLPRSSQLSPKLLVIPCSSHVLWTFIDLYSDTTKGLLLDIFIVFGTTVSDEAAFVSTARRLNSSYFESQFCVLNAVVHLL